MKQIREDFEVERMVFYVGSGDVDMPRKRKPRPKLKRWPKPNEEEQNKTEATDEFAFDFQLTFE